MNLLAIDTVTENCSIGLVVDQQPERLLETVTPAGHSKMVHGMINQLMADAAISFKDLDGIVVDIGPGSFTGVRIGIGIAQGLGYGAGLHCLPVSSLQALAAHCDAGLCLSAIDARMNQVYWALFQCHHPVPKMLCGPFVSDPGRVAHMLGELAILEEFPAAGIFGSGSGWEAYRNELPTALHGAEIRVVANRYPGAAQLLKICLGMITKPDLEDTPLVSPLGLQAAYVRNDIVQSARGKAN